jgi:hypothetical protein
MGELQERPGFCTAGAAGVACQKRPPSVSPPPPADA